MVTKDTVTKADKEIYERIQSFLPDHIFDMHAHIYDCEFLPNSGREGTVCRKCGRSVGVDAFLEQQGAFYGAAEVRGNLIIFPDGAMGDCSTGLRDRSTQFLREELERHPEFVGEVIVVPEDTEASIRKQLCHPNIRGLKCYHVMAKTPGSTFDCGVEAYLPESAWRIADEMELCITLHMVRKNALSDPGNMAYIRRKAKEYPNARLILAHAARGFAAWTVMEAAAQLQDLPNVYMDVSAICEPAPILACLQAVGIDRVFWGSDFPVSAEIGTCLSLGSGFLWLYENELKSISEEAFQTAPHIGMQALQACCQACSLAGCSREDAEKLFYGNAMKFFRLTEK